MYSIIPSANECFCNFPVCSTALGFNLQYCPYLHGNRGKRFFPLPQSINPARSPGAGCHCPNWIAGLGGILSGQVHRNQAHLPGVKYSARCRIRSTCGRSLAAWAVEGLDRKSCGYSLPGWMWLWELLTCGRPVAEGLDTNTVLWISVPSRVRVTLEHLSCPESREQAISGLARNRLQMKFIRVCWLRGHCITTSVIEESFCQKTVLTPKKPTVALSFSVVMCWNRKNSVKRETVQVYGGTPLVGGQQREKRIGRFRTSLWWNCELADIPSIAWWLFEGFAGASEGS